MLYTLKDVDIGVGEITSKILKELYYKEYLDPLSEDIYNSYKFKDLLKLSDKELSKKIVNLDSTKIERITAIVFILGKYYELGTIASCNEINYIINSEIKEEDKLEIINGSKELRYEDIINIPLKKIFEESEKYNRWLEKEQFIMALRRKNKLFKNGNTKEFLMNDYIESMQKGNNVFSVFNIALSDDRLDICSFLEDKVIDESWKIDLGSCKNYSMLIYALSLTDESVYDPKKYPILINQILNIPGFYRIKELENYFNNIFDTDEWENISEESNNIITKAIKNSDPETINYINIILEITLTDKELYKLILLRGSNSFFEKTSKILDYENISQEMEAKYLPLIRDYSSLLIYFQEINYLYWPLAIPTISGMKYEDIYTCDINSDIYIGLSKFRYIVNNENVTITKEIWKKSLEKAFINGHWIIIKEIIKYYPNIKINNNIKIINSLSILDGEYYKMNLNKIFLGNKYIRNFDISTLIIRSAANEQDNIKIYDFVNSFNINITKTIDDSIKSAKKVNNYNIYYELLNRKKCLI